MTDVASSRLIRDFWNTYAETIVPSDANTRQWKATFYAGAWAVVGALRKLRANPKLALEIDHALALLIDELEEFRTDEMGGS